MKSKIAAAISLALWILWNVLLEFEYEYNWVIRLLFACSLGRVLVYAWLYDEIHRNWIKAEQLAIDKICYCNLHIQSEKEIYEEQMRRMKKKF